MSNAENEHVQQAAAWIQKLRNDVGRVIVGQQHLVDRLLVRLLANGHVLLEGVPGLAKTLSVRTLASATQAPIPSYPVHSGPPAHRNHRPFGTVNHPTSEGRFSQYFEETQLEELICQPHQARP